MSEIDGLTREAGEESPDWPEGRLYRIDATASEMRIIVYPDGPLARFGHAHVIADAAIEGEVILAEPFDQSAFRLKIDVNSLQVDRRKWLEEEGFATDLSDQAIADTRRNLLSEDVLDAERFPTIQIESTSLSGPAWQPDIEVRIELAGTRRELTVPVSLAVNQSQLTATGRFVFNQSDFGITPFSAAGGNLRVADAVLVRFRLVAGQP